mgnify:CR=1 FL=1
MACVSLLLASVGWAVVSPVWAALEIPADRNQQWVLQLGYFANLDNALNLKSLLTGAGFEVRVLTTGKPGAERYTVVTGRAGRVAELEGLRQEVIEKTGTEGFVTKDPSDNNNAREVFDQPQSSYLLAQAAPAAGDPANPMRSANYDSNTGLTPQEEIDSIPGFTAGGIQWVPTLGLTLGYDDNVTYARQDALLGPISSWFYVISPAIRAEIPSDHSVLTLEAGIENVHDIIGDIDQALAAAK